MPLPDNHPLSEYVVNCHSTSIGDSPIVARAVVPFRGKVTKLTSVISAAITGIDGVVTAAINGTAITGGAITITQSGSAAGDMDSVNPTAANVVNEGDVISFTPSVAAGAAVQATFMAHIKRH